MPRVGHHGIQHKGGVGLRLYPRGDQIGVLDPDRALAVVPLGEMLQVQQLPPDHDQVAGRARVGGSPVSSSNTTSLLIRYRERIDDVLMRYVSKLRAEQWFDHDLPACSG